MTRNYCEVCSSYICDCWNRDKIKRLVEKIAALTKENKRLQSQNPCKDCLYLGMKKEIDALKAELKQQLNEGIEITHDLSVKNDLLKEQIATLTAACQLAYRKHHLDDQTIGWDELSEELLNTLCNVMGDEGFLKWVNVLWGEEAV